MSVSKQEKVHVVDHILSNDSSKKSPHEILLALNFSHINAVDTISAWQIIQTTDIQKSSCASVSLTCIAETLNDEKGCWLLAICYRRLAVGYGLLFH